MCQALFILHTVEVWILSTLLILHLRSITTETFYVYKTSEAYINTPNNICSDTHAELDFETCLKNAVERKINCTIPDMTLYNPLPTNHDLQRTVCSTPEQFTSYIRWFQHIKLQSESGIYNELGCMPKCKRNKYDIRKEKNNIVLAIAKKWFIT